MTGSLPLYVQKALVGRLLGFQAIAPRRVLLDSHDAHWAGDLLALSLCRLTDAALDDVDNEEPLELFLEGLVRDMRDTAALVMSDDREVIVAILDDLAELVGHFCASPYDPFRELADAAARTAADFYQFYGAGVPAELWDQTGPVFGFLRGKTELSFDPSVHLQVYTEFATEDWRPARVVLKLVPRWFDADTIASLPRALLHEYISHVPQGPYFAPRTHPDAADGFAEGWMDYIAHSVHQSTLDREGLADTLAKHLLLTWISLHRRAAERFYNARCAGSAQDRTAAERRLGATAAHDLHDELRRLVKTSALRTTVKADDLMYRLSFGLNSSRLSNAARRRFVTAVHLHTLRASRSDILVNALRNWELGNLELEDLVARVLA